MNGIKHGYVRYTRGCRCEVCREAKAAYVRAHRQTGYQRATAARLRGADYVASGIKHGYSGYQNHGCRCQPCRNAKSQYDASRRLVLS